MNKAVLIYNPLAGDHSIAMKLDYVIQRFHENNIFLQLYRFYEYDDQTILQLIKQPDIDFIIISGGDGTINYVVNIMLHNNISLPVGIIPAGTSNDFAYSLSLNNNIDRCLDIIIKGRTFNVDVGQINGTDYFLSSCAGGIFVDVSFNTHHELKKNFGHLAYEVDDIYAACRTLMDGGVTINRPPRLLNARMR